MKQIVYIFLFLIFGTTLTFSQCDKLKKKQIYRMLGAAQYDNSKSSDILNSPNFYSEEYQINLFKGVVYKLVFDVSNMPEGVTIFLYDLGKKRGIEKYEEVFNSSIAKPTKNNTYEVTMEFPQRKMLVKYEVKENTDPGCVSFILGYYFKNYIR